MIPGTPVCLTRGTTAFFATTFYDQAGAVSQPNGASLNVVFIENGVTTTASIDMTAPASPSVQWTAEWDSRGADPGRVWWSIHSVMSGIPYTVGDGSFELTANNANLPTF